MAKFYLTNKAVEDLGEIWNYTVQTWSENQAEIYYSLLIDSCQELANKSSLGKSYDVVEKNILGFKGSRIAKLDELIKLIIEENI